MFLSVIPVCTSNKHSLMLPVHHTWRFTLPGTCSWPHLALNWNLLALSSSVQSPGYDETWHAVVPNQSTHSTAISHRFFDILTRISVSLAISFFLCCACRSIIWIIISSLGGVHLPLVYVSVILEIILRSYGCSLPWACNKRYRVTFMRSSFSWWSHQTGYSSALIFSPSTKREREKELSSLKCSMPSLWSVSLHMSHEVQIVCLLTCQSRSCHS